MSPINSTKQALRMMAGYRTSIPRTTVSLPMRWYEDRGLLDPPRRVLDYGAGQDVHPYHKFDPAYYPNYRLLQQKWDVITCNYVLNVVALAHNRIELLLALKSMLAQEGYILMSVWRKDEIDTSSVKGFQCGWSCENWHSLFERFFSVVKLPATDFYGWKLEPYVEQH